MGCLNIPKGLKPLLPSLKEKKRYLVFNLVSKSQIKDFKAISSSIMGSFTRYFGEFGIAEAGLMVLKERWNAEKQTGIIKVNNKWVDQLKASLALIKEINNKKVIVKSVGVSGILKKTDKFLKN